MNRIQKVKAGLSRPEYRSDTERLVKLAFEHGVILTLHEAECIWEDYSDSMAAGWMNLPKDDQEVWEIMNGEAY